MPKGWLTEDGPRPDLAVTYGLEEAETAAYPERTERNVLASDGTVVFGDARSRGSMLTASLCQRHGKPCCMIRSMTTRERGGPAPRLAHRAPDQDAQRRRQPRQPGAGHRGIRHRRS